MPGDVDEGLSAPAHSCVKNVDPNVAVFLQGIGNAQHEHSAVHIHDGFLEKYAARSESVAQPYHHHGDDDHRRRQPGDGTTQPVGQSIDESSQDGASVAISDASIGARVSSAITLANKPKPTHVLFAKARKQPARSRLRIKTCW